MQSVRGLQAENSLEYHWSLYEAENCLEYQWSLYEAENCLEYHWSLYEVFRWKQIQMDSSFC